MNKKTHRGSAFRNFLKEQGILEEVETRALKQVVSLQLGRLRSEMELTKNGNGGAQSLSASACRESFVGSRDSQALLRSHAAQTLYWPDRFFVLKQSAETGPCDPRAPALLG